MSKKNLIIIMLSMFGIGLVMRLVPHPGNFSPVAAIALFAGFYFSKKWAIILPLAIMFLSDLAIGTYDWKLMAVVYACMALAGAIGVMARKHKNTATIITSSLAVSVIFFLATNFAVWLFSAWYTRDFSGLMQCYALAVPFFRNNLLGNLFYTGVFFGSYELMMLAVKNRMLIAEKVKVQQ
jgi:hypothetical protein